MGGGGCGCGEVGGEGEGEGAGGQGVRGRAGQLLSVKKRAVPVSSSVMAGFVPRLSGSRFDTAPESLHPRGLSPLSSPPGLSRGSTFSFAAKEHVDARDKHGHDGSLESSSNESTTRFARTAMLWCPSEGGGTGVYILGINAYHADSSACILRDGVLVAAAEEERFRRIKHWAGFPELAIRYCLAEAGVGLGDV